MAVTVAGTSNAAVLPAANVTVSGAGMMRTISALPVGVGYADITLRMTAPGGVVRTIVLPSLMVLLGRWNWWPGGMRAAARVAVREPELARV